MSTSSFMHHLTVGIEAVNREGLDQHLELRHGKIAVGIVWRRAMRIAKAATVARNHRKRHNLADSGGIAKPRNRRQRCHLIGIEVADC
jgi:hypothetical protein